MAPFSKHLQWRVDGEDQSTILEQSEPLVFKFVDREVAPSQSLQQEYWWKHHSGYALAVMLYYAEYSTELQYRDLRFFAQYIATSLGNASAAKRWDMKYQWPSFMTDDGTPIELSWDWGTQNDPPTIRYSIEPVGMHAGTSLDPFNDVAGAQLHQKLLQSSEECQDEWFKYFLAEFNQPRGLKSLSDIYIHQHQGHSSHIFYAFDLTKVNISSKAYFFPASKAQRDGCTNFEAIYRAISSAPHCTNHNTKALQVFRDFALEPGREALEYDMLAIDLTQPQHSRLKIYMRSRETNFQSVADILTLGGRLQNLKLNQGIKDLSLLWNCLFQVENPEESLRFVDHRTAGILYNVEFKLGALLPTTKIYVPVRHYSRSDDQIIQGLASYLLYHQRAKYLQNYLKTMATLFNSNSMKARAGIQTYIGVSIRHDGCLRLVSYIKPEARRM
ncbi:hypothetical protein EAF04_007351 [Stromatinia cepivora]|nr:hypothetical protein EAF04_007351 [Stromatinia cepivora]